MVVGRTRDFVIADVVAIEFHMPAQQQIAMQRAAG
jgi:hypothetical protein